MYYQKHFSGSAAATTGNLSLITTDRKSGTTLQATYGSLNRSKILCNAMASTLRDCGLDAKSAYEIGFENIPYVFLDYTKSNIGFYLYYAGTSTTASTSMLRCKIGYRTRTQTDSYIMGGTSSNYTFIEVAYGNSPFATQSYSAASEYEFAITVKGDTKSKFNIYIGTKAKPYAESYGKSNVNGHICIPVTRFLDLATNKEVWSVNCCSVTNGGDQIDTPNITTEWRTGFQPVKRDMSLTPAINSLASINVTTVYQILTQNNLMLQQDNFINLVPAYLLYPQFQIIDSYLYAGLPSNDEFYNINNEVYYRCGKVLVHCTTEVTPS